MVNTKNVKDTAAEVIGKLFYLVLIARKRGRGMVFMKSRKIELEEHQYVTSLARTEYMNPSSTMQARSSMLEHTLVTSGPKRLTSL